MGSEAKVITVVRGPAGRKVVADRLFWAACLLPSLIAVSAVFLYPLYYNLHLSFTNASVIGQLRFVGLQNYLKAFRDDAALQSLRFTLLFSAVSLSIQVALGFLLALLLQKITTGRGFFRTLIIAPLMMTPVVMALQWRMLMNYDFGILNYFAGLLGLAPQQWTTNATTAFFSVVMVDTWLNTGFVTMLLSAGLTALPREPFEAAELDGASWWQQIVKVIIPLLRPVLVVAMVFRTYGLLRTFDLIFALTAGGPGRATEAFSYHIYQEMFTAGELGYSAALAYILLGITLVICLSLIFTVDVEHDL
jgi:multiple sugar transport system permease protein